MNSAQENLELLPDMCFSVCLVDQKLIQIRSGEPGFYRLDQDVYKKRIKKSGYDMDEVANDLNETLGIDLTFRMAMDFGSCFGWELPGANPNAYKLGSANYKSTKDFN